MGLFCISAAVIIFQYFCQPRRQIVRLRPIGLVLILLVTLLVVHLLTPHFLSAAFPSRNLITLTVHVCDDQIVLCTRDLPHFCYRTDLEGVDRSTAPRRLHLQEAQPHVESAPSD